MSNRYRIKTSKEYTESIANNLGLSFEDISELSEFKFLEDSIKLKNKRMKENAKLAGIKGGNSTKERGHLKAAGKAGAEANKKSGQIHNKFIPAGNAKIQEMIESGEWKEISSKGWAGIKDKDAARARMKETAKLAQTPEVKARAQATKRIGKLKKWKVFYDQLEDIHTTKQADQISSSMGKPSSFGRAIMKKLGVKVKFTGKTMVYKKRDNYETEYLNGNL